MTLTQIKPAGLSTPITVGDAERIKLGNDGDLEFYHTGIETFIKNSTGTLNINNDGVTQLKNYADNEFLAKFTSNGAVELYYDNSKKLETTSGGATITGALTTTNAATSNSVFATTNNNTRSTIELNGKDSSGNEVKLRLGGFGDTNRGEIFTVTNHDIGFATNNNAPQMILDTSGNLNIPNDSGKIRLGTSGDLTIYHDGAASLIENATGNLALRAKTAENSIVMIPDDKVALFYDNVKKFETVTGGVKVYGHIYADDTKELRLGNDGDLQLWHGSDSNSRIYNALNTLYIRTSRGGLISSGESEWGVLFTENGSVNLYYDGSKKLQTLSTGAQVTGRFHVGTSSALINETSMSVTAAGNAAVFRATGATGHNPIICWNNATSGNRSQIQFGDGTSFSSHGTITTNGANVTYGGTSDYRLKQDEVLITDGIEKIKQLLPKRFKWKNNLDLGICDGFFAHEVQETIPTAQAVVGTKDAVDSDGNAIHQQIDHAKLIPILTAALKESISKIETLETEVAALKAA